jgi:type IV pilus assembly protein PilE
LRTLLIGGFQAVGDERPARRDWRRRHTALKSVNSFTICGMVAASVHRDPGRRPLCGFTLIELMIVVIVIAVLAVIALPAFMEQVRKSRRAEAITLLNAISQGQERWRANNPAYTTVLSASGVNVANPSTGYYTLQIASANATGYTAAASAAGGQAADLKCTQLRLVMNQGAASYQSSGTATANQCWNR